MANENTWTIVNGIFSVEGMPIGYPSVMTEPYLPFYWFVKNNDLTTEYIPDLMITGAFANTGLKSIVIPSSMTSIGEYAFANTQLKKVSIPKGCSYKSNSFPPGCVVNEY